MTRPTGSLIFLSVYLTCPDTGAPIPPSPAHIKAGIMMLIDENVMTAEEIREEALRDYNVIIPAEYLPRR